MLGISFLESQNVYSGKALKRLLVLTLVLQIGKLSLK